MEILLIPVVAIVVGIYTYIKVGAAFMPGLFFGALVWCLISGNFGIVFLDIAIVAIIIVFLYFGLIRFK